MNNKLALMTAMSVFLAAACETAQSRTQMASISYGRITSVVPATDPSGGSGRAAGTLVGGMVGLASGSGQSGSNRALRTIGGAAVGGAVGGASDASRRTPNVFTVRMANGQDLRITSDQGGLRTGDCVAIERGDFSNIRRVGEVFCETPAAAALSDMQHEADLCQEARAQVANASAAALDTAIIRMRALCDD
jgi:outer membrane lipoprotein SlyB